MQVQLVRSAQISIRNKTNIQMNYIIFYEFVWVVCLFRKLNRSSLALKKVNWKINRDW